MTKNYGDKRERITAKKKAFAGPLDVIGNYPKRFLICYNSFFEFERFDPDRLIVVTVVVVTS